MCRRREGRTSAISLDSFKAEHFENFRAKLIRIGTALPSKFNYALRKDFLRQLGMRTGLNCHACLFIGLRHRFDNFWLKRLISERHGITIAIVGVVPLALLADRSRM